MGKGKSDLRVIVDFRCDGRIIVDGVFGSEGEAGGGGALGPGQLNARAKSRRNLRETSEKRDQRHCKAIQTGTISKMLPPPPFFARWGLQPKR